MPHIYTATMIAHARLHTRKYVHVRMHARTRVPSGYVPATYVCVHVHTYMCACKHVHMYQVVMYLFAVTCRDRLAAALPLEVNEGANAAAELLSPADTMASTS